jgi:AcrR family transcriptional regulator
VTEPSRRERKKAHTRALIAEAALKLFLERGFDGVTVKEVAELADVSPTTVFTHFPSKESLVFDEDPGYEANLVAAVRDRAPGQGVIDALETHLLADRLGGDPEDSALQEFEAMIGAAPALREYGRRMVERHEEALAVAIADTSDATELQARALARFVLGSLDLARNEPDRRAALTECLRLIRTS